MKLCNILVEGKTHLALETERGLVDATAAGCTLTMDEVIAGADRAVLEAFAEDESLPVVEKPVYANVVNKTGKLLCVGLNYAEHARKTNMPLPAYPVLFSKFDNALVPAEAPVELPPWESTYDARRPDAQRPVAHRQDHAWLRPLRPGDRDGGLLRSQ